MRAFVEVNLNAISNNIKLVKSKTQAQILAVVKADAYGHGLIQLQSVRLMLVLPG